MHLLLSPNMHAPRSYLATHPLEACVRWRSSRKYSDAAICDYETRIECAENAREEADARRHVITDAWAQVERHLQAADLSAADVRSAFSRILLDGSGQLSLGPLSHSLPSFSHQHPLQRAQMPPSRLTTSNPPHSKFVLTWIIYHFSSRYPVLEYSFATPS
jgi:hypothetical protein